MKVTKVKRGWVVGRMEGAGGSYIFTLSLQYGLCCGAVSLNHGCVLRPEGELVILNADKY